MEGRVALTFDGPFSLLLSVYDALFSFGALPSLFSLLSAREQAPLEPRLSDVTEVNQQEEARAFENQLEDDLFRTPAKAASDQPVAGVGGSSSGGASLKIRIKRPKNNGKNNRKSAPLSKRAPPAPKAPIAPAPGKKREPEVMVDGQSRSGTKKSRGSAAGGNAVGLRDTVVTRQKTVEYKFVAGEMLSCKREQVRQIGRGGSCSGCNKWDEILLHIRTRNAVETDKERKALGDELLLRWGNDEEGIRQMFENMKRKNKKGFARHRYIVDQFEAQKRQMMLDEGVKLVKRPPTRQRGAADASDDESEIEQDENVAGTRDNQSGTTSEAATDVEATPLATAFDLRHRVDLTMQWPSTENHELDLDTGATLPAAFDNAPKTPISKRARDADERRSSDKRSSRRTKH